MNIVSLSAIGICSVALVVLGAALYWGFGDIFGLHDDHGPVAGAASMIGGAFGLAYAGAKAKRWI